MNKIIIVYPGSDPHRNKPETNTGISNYVPLVSITVAQHYREKGINVEVLNARRYTLRGTLLRLKKSKADKVGISVNTHSLYESVIITQEAQKQGKKVIWGGIHPRLYPKQCLEIADEVVTTDLSTKSILPAYDLLNDIEYYIPRTHYTGTDYRVLDMQLTRGCPYRCSFCINPILHEKKYIVPNVSKALKEINALIEKYNLNHIYFMDENFFVKKDFTKKIIEGLPEGVTFTANCRANYFKHFDEGMKTLLAEKCTFLSIGAESGVQRILNLIKKDITVEDIMNANLTCKELGIMPSFSFMAGLPTETISEMKQTMKFIVKLHDDNPDMYYTAQQPFRVYPGCEIYDNLKEEGKLKEPQSVLEWIQSEYDTRSGFLDEKTESFMKNMIFYSSKARRPGRTPFGKTLYKTANARINHDAYNFPIERIVTEAIWKQ